MTSSRLLSIAPQVAFLAVALTAATGCTPALSPPFDQMKGAQMTVYRLQNFVPPAAGQQPSAANPFQLPPQIQQWITAGASLLPPGLIPPGILPGTSAAPVAPDASRFPPGPQGFPILSTQQVTDPGVANDILDTLGHPASFQPPTQGCMYAELGIAIQQQGNPQPADVLVSLSCMQVQATGFQWPYQNTGLTETSEHKFASILQRVFGGR
ncbi:MAG TPA: hypothetical protein VIF09_22285 [Polyangiaceae bacterium]|jgi:hypothetical protein